MMSTILNSPASFSLVSSPCRIRFTWKSKAVVKQLSSSLPPRRNVWAKAFFLDPTNEPILKEAFKEPVAFMGGMFAGLLRLDLNEDPLKEWVARTVEASGVTEEDIDAEGPKAKEEIPQQIEIE